MDEILRRYHAAVKDITSRPYDYLNYRMSAFDQHMFLSKFQRIGRVIPVVAMEVKHQRILNQLLNDLERLSKVLYRYGEDPPIPKNFSPTTG